MSESMHRSAAPGEVLVYPRGDADPVAAHEAFGLRATILALDHRLEEAAAQYAYASAHLADATVALHEARAQLQYAEELATARLVIEGQGRNADERKALLAAGLWDDEEVDQARSRRDEALADHTACEARFREADQAQKALRTRLAALTALVGGGS